MRIIIAVFAVMFIGCNSSSRVIEDYSDDLGDGQISVVSADSSSIPRYEGYWYNRRNAFASTGLYSYRREFGSADSARKFIADKREEYRLYLLDLAKKISKRDSVATSAKNGQ